MADETANLMLPYLLASQAQKHVTVNESLARLDGLVQLAVQSRTITAQPGAPDEGVRYILPAAATGVAWAGKSAGYVAHYHDGVWEFIAPKPGFVAFCAEEEALLFFDGANWRFVATLVDAILNAEIFALGGETDSATPFFARLGKALFTAKLAADGGDGDLRVILNKETAGDSGSLLFQTNFSGRAEIGLTGDDDLHVKVSGDGATWFQALKIAHDTGIAALPKGATVASLNGGPLAGFRNRLINGDFQINQRAFAGGALAAGIYGFDRWKAGAGGAAISLGGKTLTLTSGSIVQIMEAPDLAGAQVTVSVEDLTTRDLTITLAASGSGSGSVSGDIVQGTGRCGVALTIPATATGNISLEIAPKSGGAGAPTFRKVQVEPGAFATPFEFRPAATEKALAQRYYCEIYGPALNADFAPSAVINEFVTGAFPSPMRATPTATLASVSLSLNVAGGYPTLTPLDDARARVQVQNASAARCLLGFSGNHKFTAEL
jgi:hypothetical protein